MMYYAIDWYDEDEVRNIVMKGTVVVQGTARCEEVWDKLVAEHSACYRTQISKEQFYEHIYPFG
jgi:hypothetical protein